MIDGHELVKYEWYDETSQFDPDPSKRWCYGSDCYIRLYTTWVPARILRLGLADEYLERHDDIIHYVPPEDREAFIKQEFEDQNKMVSFA